MVRFDPYVNLVTAIIIDAISIVNRQSAATDYQRRNALEFLQSNKCQRWALIAGVDFRDCVRKENSKVKI